MKNDKSKDEYKMSFPFMDDKINLEQRVKDLLNRLTIEDKFSLCSGWHHWHTSQIKNLGVRSFTMFDGPHGVRPGNNIDQKVTYFPCTICRASTWNPELTYEMGVAIAQEVRELGGNMLLAPGVNIQRSPMCGRTFEYQSEDPYLNRVLAVAFIKGVQSQRIAACIKHFICNNQETNRKRVDVKVSERALQEIYFPAFRAAVKEADVWSIMGSYNKINGVYACSHKELLDNILMKNWGFRGFVVSDWGATDYIETTEECIHAGLSLEMPRAVRYKRKNLREAFKNGTITENELNSIISRLLRVMILTGLFDSTDLLPKGSRNTPNHQAISRKIAEEGMVLLKNERNLLPLDISKIKNIAILGPNINVKPSADPDVTGSSSVYPLYEITPIEGIMKKCKGKINIIDSPSQADYVLIFAGLNHKLGMDAEDRDKEAFNLPEEQVKLIINTIEMNRNTIVVLFNGSPIGMNNWIEKIPTVVEAWYGGMEAGNVIADIIFGDVNPSGKLPITFPKILSDSPAHKSQKTFPGNDEVYYEEGIFVGYRYFDKKKINPLFPFGYGLSYTTFKYDKIKVENNRVTGDDTIRVSVELENTGDKEGAEVVQLYLHDMESSLPRPFKELKRFKKIFLKPKQKETINFELKREDLAFFDENENDWVVENGTFKILIGSSSEDIRLEIEFNYFN